MATWAPKVVFRKPKQIEPERVLVFVVVQVLEEAAASFGLPDINKTVEIRGGLALTLGVKQRVNVSTVCADSRFESRPAATNECSPNFLAPTLAQTSMTVRGEW
jgi:hypothetical protein